MEQDQTLAAPMLHMIFMAACIVALIIVYRVPWFDLRSLKRMASHRAAKMGADGDKTPGDAGIAADMFDRPDLGAILNLLVILGTALAMLIGWRVPAEIE